MFLEIKGRRVVISPTKEDQLLAEKLNRGLIERMAYGRLDNQEEGAAERLLNALSVEFLSLLKQCAESPVPERVRAFFRWLITEGGNQQFELAIISGELCARFRNCPTMEWEIIPPGCIRVMSEALDHDCSSAYKATILLLLRIGMVGHAECLTVFVS